MKRSDFLKRIGWFIPAAIVAPKIVAQIVSDSEEANEVFDKKAIQDRIDFLRQHTRTEKDSFTANEIIKIYDETGNVVIGSRRDDFLGYRPRLKGVYNFTS